VVGTLMIRSQDQEPGIPVIQNKLKGMELGGQLGPHNRQIHPSIQFRSTVPKMYSHPHFAPQKIPMGNHRMGYS
jgi:hypothetical protein